ncbi:uncharacterized protein SPSK_10913 [Sporothrix schenckii 1099-18]|uniref:Uncharacterized protein n=1 Tax=Sporothrix schenckii 1099-18 TaxID=1397361 RepID=A0A0F2MB45_SPOSC|nr:uncharacterized protein SPSK_10913 [Sporothrix schenckii 1099-18]KJR85391.1 hypothetical protein SPSK_10913 [Sporothrix schenckii 1099-18]
MALKTPWRQVQSFPLYEVVAILLPSQPCADRVSYLHWSILHIEITPNTDNFSVSASPVPKRPPQGRSSVQHTKRAECIVWCVWVAGCVALKVRGHVPYAEARRRSLFMPSMLYGNTYRVSQYTDSYHGM